LSLLGRRLVRAVSANVAQTSPDDPDPRLRGRTLGIPFDRVWNEARELAGRLRGWQVIEADDYAGLIHAEARTMLFGRVGDVVITVGLDENAQTRVDLKSSSRKGGGDFGTNARRISKFLRQLDRALAGPDPQRKVTGQAD
jgi:hypothetical protein